MQRPHIICHMITSIDGRLLAERWPTPEHALLKVYDDAARRLDADGWIVGRRTMQHYLPSGEPCLGSADGPRVDRIAERHGRGIAICFDRKGQLRPGSGDIDGDHLVLVVSRRVTEAHVDELAARGVSVLFASADMDGADADGVADVLSRIAAAFAVRRLLLEGGGRINGTFLATGLIDETSTLIYPVVDGQRGVAAIYDHQGTTDARSLELISVEALESGSVWLRHRVKH